MRTYQIQEADMKKKKIILTGAAVAAVVVIGIGAWTLFLSLIHISEPTRH